MMKELLARSQTLHELGASHERLEVLNQYLDHLMTSNEELNLVSRKMSLTELVDNHLIDCLLPLKYFPQDAKIVADLGSGGGLPGVVYAILFPHIQFVLFEKSPKKQIFLESCKRFAPNIQVLGEINSHNLRSVDLIIARGFKPLDVILDLTKDHFKNKKQYFLLKARLEKINEEILASKKHLKDQTPKIISLSSPVLEVERHLVKINSI